MSKQVRLNWKAFRMLAKHNPWPFNPKSPNAWRGETGVQVLIGNLYARVQWFYATRENDCDGVDGYKRINIAPRWARWFSIVTYSRMFHLTVGHFNFSVIRRHDGILS